jgi:membrane fusion protein, heavy metal efflux system
MKTNIPDKLRITPLPQPCGSVHLRQPASALAITAALAFVLTGCKSSGSQAAGSLPSNAPNAFQVTVSPNLLSQLKIGAPEWQEVSRSLQVAARLEADATRMARIGTPVTGRIADLVAMEGESVRHGQVIAKVHSTDLSGAEFALLKASSQRLTAQRGVERAQQLLTAGVIGSAELLRRQAELQEVTAEVSASRSQLKVLGMADDAILDLETSHKIDSVSNIVSSVDGTVLERKVTLGQVVQPAETIFVIADLSNVWLIADVPEEYAGALSIGKRVEAGVIAFPGEKIGGKLSFINQIVDPETRTVRTRMNLSNPRRLYKPAMLASMELQDNPKRQLVIPRSAVVREDDKDHVFVQTGANSFQLRQVALDGDFREGRVLLEGVRSTDKIVLAGAFDLNNERKLKLMGAR